MKCYAGRTVEEQKIYNYRNTKIQDGKRGKPAFLLSEAEIQTLLDEAGITIFGVGKTSNEYQLSRYGDTGDYEMGNCRFITRTENLKEQDHYKQWSAPGNEERRRKAGETGAAHWKKLIRENPEMHREYSKKGAQAVKEKWKKI
jgi:hypothetical protein